MRECPLCFNDVFDDQARVCPVCGADLESLPVPPPGPAVLSDEIRKPEPEIDEELLQFRKQFEGKGIYLPGKILERAREILHTAETEMRRATVMMVDVRGFSRLGHQVTPEELSLFEREFYKLASDCILRRSGFVVEFVGDAVLAVFGAPVAFDFDTESALLAALDIRECCEQAGTTEREMSVRIGIATGPIQSGLIDAPYGKAYHIVGGTINLAARLQTAAETNEILLCKVTKKIAERRFELDPTPPLELKNISDHYEAYKLIGERDREIPVRSFVTPFCGRKKEMTRLEEYLSKNGGLQKIVHVQGEAGIGKSRFVHESLEKTGKKAVWWRASPSTSSILLAPVMSWLREEMDLGIHAPMESIRKAVNRYLGEKLPEEEANPLLLEYLFGDPEAIAALRGTPPERIRINLFSLFRQLLFEHWKENGSMILVADDAQWFDSLTVDFLYKLVDWPESGEMTLFLVYRSGSQPFFKMERDHLDIHMDPLRDRERKDLLKKLSPTDDFLPEIRDIVLSRAAGNPLFLEEMSRLIREVAIENNHLNGEALTNKIIEVIPVSLFDLIQSRIDRLETRTRQVLQCASLLGLDFALSLIRMFEIIQEKLEDHLHTLRALRYLGEQPEPEDIRYYFTHGLFKDVAYSTLLEEQKQRLHANLAHRLEEVFSDRISEYCELLAYHFSKGKLQQKAIYYLVKAADRQAGMGANSNALENYSTAIELLEQMPPTPPRIALLSRLLIQGGRLQRKMGDVEEAGEMLGAAMDCARKIQNERLSLEARLEQAALMVFTGEEDKAAGNLEGLIGEAFRLKSRTTEMVAVLSLGVIEWRRGNFDQALEAFQKLARMAEENKTPQVEADAFNNAGLIYWKWGQTSQALKAFKRALPLRRKVGDRFGLCATLMNIGIIQEQLGKVKGALGSYNNALKLAKKTGYGQALAALESNLSNLERRLGNHAVALEHAMEAIEHAKRIDDPKIEADGEENAGLACMALEQFKESGSHLNAALELAAKHKQLERTLSARISLVELTIRKEKPTGASIDEINSILDTIKSERYPEHFPRIYRLKARVLESLDKKNECTAGDYLEMSREIARNMGNVFEETRTLQELIAWAGRNGQDSREWEQELEGIRNMLFKNG